MKITRWIVFLVVVFSTLLSACVSTSVTGQAVGNVSQPTKQLLIVVVSGAQFKTGNIAATKGQRNLDSLVPNLVERLPAVFLRNGIPARAINAGSADATTTGQVRPLAGERVLVVTPQSATYNSQSGQTLSLSVKVLSEPPVQNTIWQGNVYMGTMGFGKFDDKVANEIGVQILEQLRKAKLVTLKEGPLQAE